MKFLKNKEVVNASWLIAGNICHMLISLIVGLMTARYLAPSNYGLINYGAAYVSLCMSLCTLGLNSVIIKEFTDNPQDQGTAIGTTLVLRLCSSFLCSVGIIAFVSIIDKDEPVTIVVVALCSVSLIFHIFDTFKYWFQYRYQSKVTAIVTFLAFFATAIYKIILLVLQKDVKWFAFASSVDYIILAALFIFAYKKHGGPRLRFDKTKAKSMLGKSYHYILSGMMVAIYGQTDKLMLKQMLGETEVGYYSTALQICNMWVFVLVAIIDSMYPTILSLHKANYKAFEKKNKQLYAIVFYVSVIVSLVLTIFGDLIIGILYGVDFSLAVNPLRLITWYTAFSYLGVARNAWIVCENKQKYLKYMYFLAAILNVILNYTLIPLLGASGAALASLITQLFTSLILPMCFKGMRRNTVLMLQAILLQDVFSKKDSNN